MCSRHCAKQAPLAWHTFQDMRAARLKYQSRAGHEVSHGLRDQDFSRSCKPRDARANVYRDAGKVVADTFAFPGV